MKEVQRITILLKDSSLETDYNQRIIEYLNDRHQELNDVGFVIAIEVIDDDNISKYIKLGITSTPALMTEEDVKYGVNSILATLAKMEIVPQQATLANIANKENIYENAHRDLILEEMAANDQEDKNGSSTIRAGRQDFSETAMSDKDIESRMSKYTAIYDARKERNTPGRRRPPTSLPKTPSKVSNAKRNVEKLIESKGYDKGEAAFMREIAKNLE